MRRNLISLPAGMLALAASAGAAPPAADPTILTFEEARAMPVETLARRLLGDERAAAVRSVDMSMAFGRGFDMLSLMEPPAPSGRLVCTRRLHRVSLEPVDPANFRAEAQSPMRVTSIETGSALAAALADGHCPEARQSYYPTAPRNQAQVAAVLRRLVEVRAAAAAARRLPFRIHCRLGGKRDSRCPNYGRDFLAGLRLDDLGSIYPVYTTTCGLTPFDYVGGPCPVHDYSPGTGSPWDAQADPATLLGWAILLPHAAADNHSWIIGLGAGRRAGIVEMQLTLIIFH